MASVPGYLIDTNVLLRLFRKDDPLHRLIEKTLSDLIHPNQVQPSPR
jgi:predicted nucleic acid-binding protein